MPGYSASSAAPARRRAASGRRARRAARSPRSARRSARGNLMSANSAPLRCAARTPRHSRTGRDRRTSRPGSRRDTARCLRRAVPAARSRSSASVSNGSSTGTGLRVMPGKRCAIAALSRASARGTGRLALLRACRAARRAPRDAVPRRPTARPAPPASRPWPRRSAAAASPAREAAEAARPVRTLADSASRKTTTLKADPRGQRIPAPN